MYINKYFGLALLVVMVCVLGGLSFMALNDRALSAQAQARSSSDVQMISVQLMSDIEGIAVYNDGKLVVYRVWNGSNLVPVSGRVIKYDFEILDKLSSMSYSNISSNNKNYEPASLKETIDK